MQQSYNGRVDGFSLEIFHDKDIEIIIELSNRRDYYKANNST